MEPRKADSSMNWPTAVTLSILFLCVTAVVLAVIL